MTSGGAVQGQGPGPCSGYRLCFDTRPVQTAASNLYHHRNHLYASAVHIPSLDSSVIIDLYFMILIYKYVELTQ